MRTFGALWNYYSLLNEKCQEKFFPNSNEVNNLHRNILRLDLFLQQ